LDKNKLANLIKIISIVIIISAIGLEIWNIYRLVNNNKILNILIPILWAERFIVGIHIFEGVIAAIYAPSKSRLPLQYGIYTFFVGTVGLVELFKQEDK
jgi:hypothetical protein